MREGQPHGDQTRESQPEAVKDNPPRAPTTQRLGSFSLNWREVAVGVEMPAGQAKQEPDDDAVVLPPLVMQGRTETSPERAVSARR